MLSNWNLLVSHQVIHFSAHTLQLLDIPGNTITLPVALEGFIKKSAGEEVSAIIAMLACL